MKKSKFLILIIFVFSFFIVFTAKLNAATVNVNDIAQQLIVDGVGKGIINEMISKNLLSEEMMENKHNVKGFQAVFDKNNRLGIAYKVLTGKNYAFRSDDEYLNNLFDIYQEIVAQIEENGKLQELFDIARKGGRVEGDEAAEALIETIAAQVLNLKIQETSKAYKDGCYRNYWSNVKEFTYDGTSHKCSEIYYEDNGGVETLGLETFYSKFASVANAGSNNYQRAREYTVKENFDGITDKVYTNVTGKTPQTTQSNQTSSDNDAMLYYEGSNSNYIPRITNIFKHANDLYNAGKIDSLLTGKDNNSGMLEMVNQITVGFGKIGTYVIYILIIALGVVAIWSGVNGKVTFSETLPYAVIAIVIFYAAPGIVSIIKDLFTGATQNNLWFETMVKNLFASVVNIVRTLAFMGIIFNGIKLMFGGANEKANAKSGILPVFIGSILVFASSIVISFVLNISNDVTSENSNSNSNSNSSSTTSNVTYGNEYNGVTEKISRINNEILNSSEFNLSESIKTKIRGILYKYENDSSMSAQDAINEINVLIKTSDDSSITDEVKKKINEIISGT